MNKKNSFFCFLLIFFCIHQGHSQTIDTLVDCTGYSLHFVITPGKGMPILFESGFGNDATIWNTIKQPISDTTGATIITYDRQGFGKSTWDPNRKSIIDEIKGLEYALNKLGYNKNIMLVSHSLGGFYNTVFANRNQEKVKAIVFIDASLSDFYTDEELGKINAIPFVRAIVDTMKNQPSVPLEIPLIDITAEKTIEMASRWKICHDKFVSASANRKSIFAENAGHYIFLDNPQLVIDAITTIYTEKCINK